MMKKIIFSLSALLLTAIFTFVACQKDEKADTSIYAPTGALVSHSNEELAAAIASATKVDAQELTVQGIQYLNVPKGFIAEVYVMLKSQKELRKVYYISDDIIGEIHFDSDLVQVKPTVAGGVTDRVVAKETVVYCSCGTSSPFGSSSCTPSVVVTPGSISGTCSNSGCSFGCYVHIITPS